MYCTVRRENEYVKILDAQIERTDTEHSLCNCNGSV